MRRWLREPLLHFVLLGAAIFAASRIAGEPGGGARREGEIVVSAGKIEHLAVLFSRTWQRPPTRRELEGLIDDHVREEAAYREGLAMGLDRDDTILRRRIRQKLEFFAQDVIDEVQPTEEELEAYLAEHPEDFRREARLDFRQVFLDPERRGVALEADARELAARLDGNLALDPQTAGDRLGLPHAFADTSLRDVRARFGTEFAEALDELAPGSWQGPLRSGFGFHLARVDRRVEASLPALDEVRPIVLREWENARRERMLEEFYQRLLARYEVRVEWPDLGPAPAGAVSDPGGEPQAASQAVTGDAAE